MSWPEKGSAVSTLGPGFALRRREALVLGEHIFGRKDPRSPIGEHLLKCVRHLPGCNGVAVVLLPWNRRAKKLPNDRSFSVVDLDKKPRGRTRAFLMQRLKTISVTQHERHGHARVLREEFYDRISPSNFGAFHTHPGLSTGIAPPRDQRGTRKCDHSTENDCPSGVHL